MSNKHTPLKKTSYNNFSDFNKFSGQIEFLPPKDAMKIKKWKDKSYWVGRFEIERKH